MKPHLLLKIVEYGKLFQCIYENSVAIDLSSVTNPNLSGNHPMAHGIIAAWSGKPNLGQ
jgi:hypothetical protein